MVAGACRLGRLRMVMVSVIHGCAFVQSNCSQEPVFDALQPGHAPCTISSARFML